MEPGQDVTVRSTDGSTAVIGQVVALPQTTRWLQRKRMGHSRGKYAHLLSARCTCLFLSERKRKDPPVSFRAKLLPPLQDPEHPW